jgi:hypothetical protein
LRKAFTADVFFSGTNAVTGAGQLVNLDMLGNRISALLEFELDNPCVKTASCQNCKSPMRICNAWSIIEKSYPQGRIRVVLINEDLGV